jgi:hypothetical protein
MHFTSDRPQVSIGVDSPYLGPAIREFAQTLNCEDLVCEYEGHRFGKKILREAFSGVLPKEIARRLKTPMYGTGSTALKQLAEQSINDAEFEREGELDLIKLRDKEQCFYYRVYRSLLPPPKDLARSVKHCTECHGPVSRTDTRYCRICGAYPI